MRRINPLTSSVGTKFVIALTGAALFLYLLIHLAGNLVFFLGPNAFNGYAHTLTSTPLVYVFEIGLLAVFLVHIYNTVFMTIRNKQARPVPYAMKRRAGYPSRKSAASSTMIYTGLFLIVFIVIHLMDLRFGRHYTVTGTEHTRDLYRLQVEVFSNPYRVAFYTISMLFLGFHLWHGFWSATQSLGVENARRSWGLLQMSKALAILIAGGFLLIPILTYFRIFHIGGAP